MATDKKDVAIDKPDFDIIFQMGVLKLCLQDEYFCTQIVKHFANDKDLNQYSVFDNKKLHKIFIHIADSMAKFKSRPTEGQLRQRFADEPEDERELFNETLDKVLSVSTHDDEYYRQYLKTYIVQVKMAKGFKKTQKLWVDHPEDAPEFMQAIIDDIRRVTFEQEDVVTFDDLDAFIAAGADGNTRNIPTGIKELDKDLLGGVPRQTLTVVLAGSNVGKSMFSISLAANALRSTDENGVNRGFKVLHINLEGQRDEALKRYASNLSEINFDILMRGVNNLNEVEAARYKAFKEKYTDRLLIRNMLGFGGTIEDVVVYCREIYKDFRFDVLVVDYGQLLETKAKTDGLRHTMARVFRGLDSIGKELDCAVITPAQATRNSQEKQTEHVSKKDIGKAPVLRMTDISEAMEIARVAGVIFTLNMTDEEAVKGRMRLFLEKQRQGAKNKIYGLLTAFNKSNLITGKTYDPYSNANQVDGTEDQQKEVVPLKEIKIPLPKTLGEQVQNKEIQKTIASDENIINIAGNFEFSHKMRAFVDQLINDANSYRSAFFQIKESYDKERDQEDPDLDLLDQYKEKMTEMHSQINKHINEAIAFKSQAYDYNITTDTYDAICKDLTDAKKAKEPLVKIKELEAIIKHYEVFLGRYKIPAI